MARHALSNAQWLRLAPLLPPVRPPVGRPNHDQRHILNAILWILKTGALWRDLPESFGKWTTVYSRFRRWQRSSLWDHILSKLQAIGDAAGKLDWSLHFVDGSVVRAHQHAAGARRTSGPQALGRSRGGFSTKIHVRAEGRGKPAVFALSGGERHEQLMLPKLMETGAGKRPGAGRPRLRPERLAGDKGYSSRTVRRYLQRRGIVGVIPRRSNEPPDPFFNREAYRERNRVERLINRLKQHRRIATRYEKLALVYMAMLTLAAILLWL